MIMEEKKIIDYSRTYRKISADKKKCAVYIVLLIIFVFLLFWFHVGDLTRIICKFCAAELRKYEPGMYIGIRSETYPLFGKISYLSANTVYPGIGTSLINAGCSLFIVLLFAFLPCKGRPFAIYTLTVYSQLYILQEIGIWVVFFVLTVCVTGIMGNKGMGYKLATLFFVMLYSIVFGTVRYMVFVYLLYKYSVLYMALFYFMIGPLFDFLYLVMIYGMFVNRMIKIYDSRKGKEVWKWS